MRRTRLPLSSAPFLEKPSLFVGPFLTILFLMLALAPSRSIAQTNPWVHFSLSSNGPSLNGTSLVYDSGSDQIIGFGGLDPGCCNSENYVWVLTNANGISASPKWVQQAPVGPPPAPRNYASAVYDQADNRMIIFGGGQFGGNVYTTLFNDVWVLSNANGIGGTPTWTQLNPMALNGSPAPRAGHMAIYDAIGNRMTIFGGGNNGIMDVPNDVWVLTNANGLGAQPEWIELSPAGALPAPRENHVMAYDPVANKMIVFGGCCPSLNDLWVLGNANGLGGGAAWTQVSESQPPAPRETEGSFGYDVGTNYDSGSPSYNAGTNGLIFFGGSGYNPIASYNDVWLLKGASDSGSLPPTWINAIPDGLYTDPAPSTPPGGYDGISKRLMALTDTADLWILPTRNAIDMSCSAGPAFPPAVLNQIQRAGIQFVVVKAPQADNPAECDDQIETARAQLDAFSKGFKTAAYCFLHFQTMDIGTGAQQAQNCLDTIQEARYGSIAFLALDVEELPGVGVNHKDAATIIRQASTEITKTLGASKPLVIYSRYDAWNQIVGDDTEFSNQNLWTTPYHSSFVDAYNQFHCGSGVPSLYPFSQVFGGWTSRAGSQFDLGATCSGTSLSGKTVDFDVFDPGLFP